MTKELDATGLLAALLRAGVEFVVIGGLALPAHGVVRGTKDLDIVPAPDVANLGRLATVLREVEARVDLRDLDPGELGIEPDAEGLGFGGNWVFSTALGRLDVLQDVAGMGDYARLRAGAVEAPVAGVDGPVMFAGYDELVAMKVAAGRERDLMDIDDLRRARGEST